jgi:hypothetical protein
MDGLVLHPHFITSRPTDPFIPLLNHLDSFIQQGAVTISTLLRMSSIGSISNFRLIDIAKHLVSSRWTWRRFIMVFLSRDGFRCWVICRCWNCLHFLFQAQVTTWLSSTQGLMQGLFVTLHSVRRCPFQDPWFPLACLSSCFFPPPPPLFFTEIPYTLKMKRLCSSYQIIHGAITQKTTVLIFTAMKTSNHVYIHV